MLHLNRGAKGWQDREFREFPDLLRPSDLLVVNNTRVFPARLYGHRSGERAQPVSPHNPAARDFLPRTGRSAADTAGFGRSERMGMPSATGAEDRGGREAPFWRSGRIGSRGHRTRQLRGAAHPVCSDRRVLCASGAGRSCAATALYCPRGPGGGSGPVSDRLCPPARLGGGADRGPALYAGDSGADSRAQDSGS